MSQYDELFRTYNSWFNKLSATTFDTMVNNVIGEVSKIDSPFVLRNIINMLFDKALLLPNLAPMYADFCIVLLNHNVFPYFGEQKSEDNIISLVVRYY